ncbi:hypothetical protein [Nocardia sp. MDA0666]|uniref:hypothetical protein n=1 Tax=Nocardia sp. MDA0666 TaxID=2135448 RepID=UPI0011B1CE0C|nr:hypothetical protein [Nocardia sp. MDA0666]
MDDSSPRDLRAEHTTELCREDRNRRIVQVLRHDPRCFPGSRVDRSAKPLLFGEEPSGPDVPDVVGNSQRAKARLVLCCGRKLWDGLENWHDQLRPLAPAVVIDGLADAFLIRGGQFDEIVEKVDLDSILET